MNTNDSHDTDNVDDENKLSQDKMQHWLLCCDPKSLRFFAINLETQEIKLQKVHSSMNKKAKERLSHVNEMCKFNGSWFFNNQQVTSYRRRKFPNYLLSRFNNKYPNYVSNSNLSVVYAKKEFIDIYVNLEKYDQQINQSPVAQRIHEFNDIYEKELKVKAELVSSSDEIIKLILRKINSIFDIVLKPNLENNIFCLQVKGYEEYLTSDHPLMNYDRIRLIMRDNGKTQLKLEEMDFDCFQSKFPPIRTVNHISNDLDDWKDYQDVDIFFWYPPQEIEYYEKLEMLNKKIQTIKSQSLHSLRKTSNASTNAQNDYKHGQLKMKAVKIEYETYQFEKNNPQKPQLTEFRCYRKLQMQEHFDVREKEFEEFKGNPWNFKEGKELYSGELDWPFNVEVLSIENLIQLFIHIDISDYDHEEEATQDTKYDSLPTYNGLTTPSYITKEPILHVLLEDRKGGIQSRIKGQKSRSVTPKLIKEICKTPKKEKEKTPKKDKKDKEKEKEKDKEKEKEKEKDKEKEKEKEKKEEKGSKTSKKLLSDKDLVRHIVHNKRGNKFLKDLQIDYGLEFQPYLIYVEIALFHGENCLRRQRVSEYLKRGFTLQPKFNYLAQFTNMILLSQLPLESRLVIEVFMQSEEGFFQCIAFGSLSLFDEFGMLKQGIQQINLWPFYKQDARLSCQEQYWVNRRWKRNNPTDVLSMSSEVRPSTIHYHKQFTTLYLKLEEFGKPVSYSLRNNQQQSRKHDYYSLIGNVNFTNYKTSLSFNKTTPQVTFKYNCKSIFDRPTTIQLVQLNSVLSKDTLSIANLTKQEKHILVICRKHYKTQSAKLLHFLRAIDTSDPDQVIECHKMVKVWAPLTPEQALPLLDSWVGDDAIRLFAVQKLEQWRDDELALFLPQLTQSLQFDTQHFNVLVEFLLERSLKQPFVIGHELYWYLRSQLFIKPSFEKFSLILEQFLMVCGHFIFILDKEHKLLNHVTKIASDVVAESKKRASHGKSKTNKSANKEKDQEQGSEQALRDSQLQKELKKMEGTFFEKKSKYCFAIDPRQMIRGFDIKNCKTMSSKKIPLLLQCLNRQENCKNISYLFKVGDDLRQDILTLQMIKIMNKIWLDAGHDLKMSPYKVTSIWDQQGIIQFVPGQTLESIQQKKMLDVNQIALHIQDKSSGEEKEQKFDNYLYSCAAYSVTCFILGIGDRHPGNIMLQDNGKLFHIDFGHFLGNFKSKYGFKRERTAFVYTKEMHRAIIHMDLDNDNNGLEKQSRYEKFKEKCGQAYNMIRKNSDFIINIFMMMLSAGMPELQKIEDINYLVEKLHIQSTDDEAKDVFFKEIEKSKNELYRRIDNFIHNYKHKKKSNKSKKKAQDKTKEKNKIEEQKTLEPSKQQSFDLNSKLKIPDTHVLNRSSLNNNNDHKRARGHINYDDLMSIERQQAYDQEMKK